MSKSTTTTQKTEPPKWAEPALKETAAQAQNLYNAGAGFNTYGGSTVADLSNQTQTGIQNMMQAGSNTQTTNPQAYQGLATQFGNYMQNGGSVQGPAALQQTLSGEFLSQGNPYYRERLNREIGDSNALLQSAFSGSGRYGSGVNQSTIADNTSNMLMSGLEADYNRERQNQMSAIGMQLGIDTGNADRGLSAISQQLGATQAGDTAAQQNWLNRMAGAQGQIDAGQLVDQNAQFKLSDEVARWYEQDMQEWNRLGALQAAATGAAGNYGTQTGTSTQPFNVMGGVGALASLALKSDERLKEDIRLVGDHEGINIYEFRYIGGKTVWRGVMAQEVMRVMPEAVETCDDGFLAVNYAKLGMGMVRC